MVQNNVKISCGILPNGALTVIWNIQGNIWHACAIKYIDNFDSRLNFLNCMINNNYNPYKSALRYISIIIDWCATSIGLQDTFIIFQSIVPLAMSENWAWKTQMSAVLSIPNNANKINMCSNNEFLLDILSETHSRKFASVLDSIFCFGRCSRRTTVDWTNISNCAKVFSTLFGSFHFVKSYEIMRLISLNLEQNNFQLASGKLKT